MQETRRKKRRGGVCVDAVRDPLDQRKAKEKAKEKKKKTMAVERRAIEQIVGRRGRAARVFRVISTCPSRRLFRYLCKEKGEEERWTSTEFCSEEDVA